MTVNHIYGTEQSPHLCPVEPLWEILKQHVSQRSPPRPSEHQMREYLGVYPSIRATCVPEEQTRVKLSKREGWRLCELKSPLETSHADM